MNSSASIRGLVFTLSALFLAQGSFGHPLGNFSINQYFLVDVRGESPTILYLLDLAEVPSFREMEFLDSDGDGEVTGDETTAYLDKVVPELTAHLRFDHDGQNVDLVLKDRKLTLLEGTAGMKVINVALRLEPAAWSRPDGNAELDMNIESTNYPGSSGVRECKVLLDGRFTDRTMSLGRETLKYQTLVFQDAENNPVYQDFEAQFRFILEPVSETRAVGRDKGASFTWTATARAAQDAGESSIVRGMETVFEEVAVAGSDGQSLGALELREEAGFGRAEKGDEGATGALLGRVGEIIRTEELTLSMFFVALAVALALGMGHAFSPGHGKTVMAAYLIGERGTAWHALILGVIVTITHVWSVIVLGVITLYAGERISEEQLSFWTGVASGVIIMIIGGLLFVRRYGTFVLARQGAGHTHDHDHSHHDHEHAHDHGHGHSHVVAGKDGQAPTYASITWLGISGGIVPCPAALIVLLLAIKFGRLVLGLWLLFAFSLGLALVLVAIGIAVVRASGEIRKRIGERSPLLLALPVVSSVMITVLGAWVVLWTLLEFNVIVFMPVS